MANDTYGELRMESCYFRAMLQQLCEAFYIPFSSHCAPALHLHASLSLPAFTIGESFIDHTIIEERLFEGFATVYQGQLKPANRERIWIAVPVHDSGCCGMAGHFGNEMMALEKTGGITELAVKKTKAGRTH